MSRKALASALVLSTLLVGGCCSATFGGGQTTGDGGQIPPDGHTEIPGVCNGPVGTSCEFDDQCCAEGMVLLCVGGQCAADPTNSACTRSADCPVGFICTAGVCVPTGCTSDRDCPVAGSACVGGECRTDCGTDLALGGDWDWLSALPIRDALAGWVDAILGAIGDLGVVLRGESGDAWADFVGTIIRSLLPTWAWNLFDALARLDGMLTTWYIDSLVTLTPYTMRDYHAQETWTTVSFWDDYGRAWVSGSVDEVFGGGMSCPSPAVEVNPYDAHMACGVLELDRHDVQFDLRRVILWLINEVTCIATTSGGFCYPTLQAAVTDMADQFCSDAFGPLDPFRFACESAVDSVVDALFAELSCLQVHVDTLSLKGSGVVHDAAAPDPIRIDVPEGVWEGSMILGGDFLGSFTAYKR